MQTDYYSEYIPADTEESEVYEVEPKTHKKESLSIEEPNIEECANLIEEDNRSKLHTLNLEFEQKIKDRLLYSRNERKGTNNKALRFKLLENELRSLMYDIDQEAQENNTELKLQIDSFINEVETFKTKQNNDTFLNYWTQKLDDLKIDLPAEKSNNLNLIETNLDISKLIEIEERLTLLEKRVGINNTHMDQTSLGDVVQDLMLKINLILDGGKSIDLIRSEIEQLTKNCHIYLENSKKINNKSELLPLTDTKLSLLYKKIKNLPDIETTLNVITSRLKSLDEVTLQTAHNADFVNGLNTELVRIENKLDLWEHKLTDLELQFDIDRKAFNEFKKN